MFFRGINVLERARIPAQTRYAQPPWRIDIVVAKHDLNLHKWLLRKRSRQVSSIGTPA
jgi:hypothetical protein